MWKKLRVVWQIPELRQKILFTIGMLAVYRLGFQIRLPFIDASKMGATDGGLSQLLTTVSTFSGAGLDQITIFGLGIMPYISASIIFQLLGSVIPSLEQLQKEGETGRKKINEYTRYATVALCLFQSWFFLTSFVEARGMVHEDFLVGGHLPFTWRIVAVLTMTAGTVFLMWIGEQIDEYGIGNGISLIIMAGILARMPAAGWDLIQQYSGELGGTGIGPEKILLLVAMFIAVVVGVVFITLGQRRIPMQSAKHIRGRRAMGGQKSYLPLKVNQAGVMPIIFASSLLLFPMIIFQQLLNVFTAESGFFSGTGWMHGFIDWWVEALRAHNYVYNLLYLILIYFFCFFWTAITFNPKDMADNLKNFGSFIPGYRPGKRTADYLEKVMVRITYVGAGFLALIAIIPTVVSGALNVDYSIAMFYGGTSLLIAVSVAFDLVQKIDSHLVMRNYKGLLE